MVKGILLNALCFIACLNGFSEQKRPVLLSDSTLVTIKIDGNVVAEWNIGPDTKPWTEPDVFAIERSFKEKKVTYLSNRDSVLITLRPGEKYDFDIFIKNRGTFPIRLTTFNEPVFLHTRIIISICLVILVISWLTYAKRKALRITPLLYLGIITPLLFWLATIVGGFIHGNYNHLHNVVSELGALGTTSEVFMSSMEVLVSILSIFSIVGFYKACKKIDLNPIPVLTILALPISMFWAGVFPMHHELHGTIGPIPLLLNIGALLAIVLWRGKEFLRIRLVSLLCLFLMSLILLRFIPNLRGNWEGLIQRLFYLGWSIWSVGLSFIFISMLKKEAQMY
jgi:hypothetical membrane protein